MTRAERRRLEKGTKAKEATYNLTTGQITAMVEDTMKSEFERVRHEGYEAGFRQAMIMTLAIPCEVLMQHYWKKSYKDRLPEFVQHMLDILEEIDTDKTTLQELNDHLWEYGGVKFTEQEV